LGAVLAESDCFSELYSRVEADFQDRLPGYHKSRREGLSVLASVVLNTRSVNLMENASALPRKIIAVDHRYQYISRLSGNSHIDTDEVLQAFVGEIFRRHSEAGETTVLALDQSKINEGHEVLMLSVRMRDRALPVAWRVRKTKGPIGWRDWQNFADRLDAKILTMIINEHGHLFRRRSRSAAAKKADTLREECRWLA